MVIAAVSRVSCPLPRFADQFLPGLCQPGESLIGSCLDRRQVNAGIGQCLAEHRNRIFGIAERFRYD